jgi:hypothetical protein
VRFRPNPNLRQELEREAAHQVALKVAAEDVAGKARSIAHRIMPAGAGEQIVVQQEGTEVVVANLAHGGHLDEWGSINSPAYAPLRRGVREAGLRLDD